MFDVRVLDRAFDRIGLRQTVVPAGTTSFSPFMAKFERPQTIMVEAQIHTTNFSIEYAYQDCPGLRVGDRLQIDGQIFEVQQPPARQGDGHYAVAQLEETR